MFGSVIPLYLCLSKIQGFLLFTTDACPCILLTSSSDRPVTDHGSAFPNGWGRSPNDGYQMEY